MNPKLRLCNILTKTSLAIATFIRQGSPSFPLPIPYYITFYFSSVILDHPWQHGLHLLHINRKLKFGNTVFLDNTVTSKRGIWHFRRTSVSIVVLFCTASVSGCFGLILRKILAFCGSLSAFTTRKKIVSSNIRSDNQFPTTETSLLRRRLEICADTSKGA